MNVRFLLLLAVVAVSCGDSGTDRGSTDDLVAVPVAARKVSNADPAVAGHALAAAEVESVRETGTVNPWNGLIEDPALRTALADRFGESYMWSPTQLEGYAKCPWSWVNLNPPKYWN